MFIPFFGARLSLSERHNYIFWRALWPSALSSRLIRVMAAQALVLSAGKKQSKQVGQTPEIRKSFSLELKVVT